MKREKVKVAKLAENPNNPRLLKADKKNKLEKSIKEFPEMLEARPIVVNKDYTILGGNMRYKALVASGVKEADVLVVDWSEDKQREFIIKDNVGFGEWDWDDLATWDQEELIDWGMELPEVNEKGEVIEAEVEFSEYLDEQHNYVVLYFDNRIDWLQAETHFNLKSVNAKRSNGKPWSKGIGRVINGAKYLKKLTENV